MSLQQRKPKMNIVHILPIITCIYCFSGNQNVTCVVLKRKNNDFLGNFNIILCKEQFFLLRRQTCPLGISHTPPPEGRIMVSTQYSVWFSHFQKLCSMICAVLKDTKPSLGFSLHSAFLTENLQHTDYDEKANYPLCKFITQKH